MAVLIAVLGGLSIISMPKDIFPYIDIPVLSVIWSYNGISPDEMASRITTVFERGLTGTVNDIEHIESSSYNGVSRHPHLLSAQRQDRPRHRPGRRRSRQPIQRILPPGIFPPGVIKFDASSVPILQLSLSSKTLSEQELYDLGANFIRTQLATIQGATIPPPYGGKQRQIMVDLDPDALYAHDLSATDISNALNNQNLIIPSGTAKMGDREYFIHLNCSPTTVQGVNDLPVKIVNGAVVYMQDVAQVRDGFSVQTNIVREDGRRSALMTVIKNGQASTLDIVNGIKADPAESHGWHARVAHRPPAVRPEPLRQRRHQRRGPRRPHCRRPHCPHDPAVPRQLAQHGHRLHLDPAFHPDLLHRPLGARLHHQRHDARRHGARRRHPR